MPAGFRLTGFFWTSVMANCFVRMSATYPSAVVPSPMAGIFAGHLEELGEERIAAFGL